MSTLGAATLDYYGPKIEDHDDTITRNDLLSVPPQSQKLCSLRWSHIRQSFGQSRSQIQKKS